MINSKWTITSLKAVCIEKEAQWMQIAFHCKGRFQLVKMPIRTPQDLDMYLVVDHR